MLYQWIGFSSYYHIILYLILLTLLLSYNHAVPQYEPDETKRGVNLNSNDLDFGFASSCNISVSPTTFKKIQVGDFEWVNVTCSCCKGFNTSDMYAVLRYKLEQQGIEPPANESVGIYVMRVNSRNRNIASPSRFNYRKRGQYNGLVDCDKKKRCVDLNDYVPFHHKGFYFEANQVGRAVITISLNWCNTTVMELKKKKYFIEEASSEPLVILGSAKVITNIVRKHRNFYTAYDWSAVFIACLIALSAGCVTETAQIRKHLTQPLGLIAALVSQHVFMPLIAFSINLAIGLSTDLAFGLFVTTTLPGGGLAHLIVFLMDGDRALSTVVSACNSVLNLIISPCWLLAMNWYFDIEDLQFELFILWLAPVFVCQTTGLVLRHFKPTAADAVMNWFTRPLLLLSGILLITLGIYVNQYAFNGINYNLILAVSLTIFGGFLVGGIAGLVTRQNKEAVRAIAAETSVYNCLIVIPTLRNSLPQPDADLAVTVPLWAFFFTPAPVLIYHVMHQARKVTSDFIEKRKEKQYRHYSVVSSLAKMTEDVTAVSAPLALDDQTSLPGPDQRSVNDGANGKSGKGAERTTAL